MNFSQFLNESAILLTKDMKIFSDLLVDKLVEICYSHVTYPYLTRQMDGKVVLEKEIDSKFGKDLIKVRLKIKDTNKEAVADIDNKEIIVYVSKDNYEKFKAKNKEFLTEFRKIIRHELIHLVDPKLNKDGLKEKSKEQIENLNKELINLTKKLKVETDKDKIQEIENEIDKNYDLYFKFPWEVDAYISTEAEEVFERILKNSRMKKDALYYLKNIKPLNSVQKFYHKHEKLWKRFVLHINKLIEREYDNG